MRWLLLLFILVPAIEVTLLAKIVGWMGGLETLALIVATGIAGAALAKRQGLGVMRKIQAETAQGRMPAGSLIDGAIILVAGILLVTPGVMTDVIGFLLLIPPLRALVETALRKRFEKAVLRGSVQVIRPEPIGPIGPVIDVTPEPDRRKDQLT